MIIRTDFLYFTELTLTYQISEFAHEPYRLLNAMLGKFYKPNTCNQEANLSIVFCNSLLIGM